MFIFLDSTSHHRHSFCQKLIGIGCSGYNTNWFLQYLQSSPEDALLLPPQQQHVVLVVIFFGANDASLPDLNPRQYVSVANYQQNLRAMIQLAQSTHPSAKILLVAPPPVVHEQRLQYQIQRYGEELATGKLERTLENAGIYAQAAEQVGLDCNVPCLNLWKEMQQDAPTTIQPSSTEALEKQPTTPSWSRFFCDGLHFSKEGHEFVGQAVVRCIQECFPTLAVTADPLTGQWANVSSTCGSDLKFQGPPFHEEIDPNNVKAAFDKYYGTTTATTPAALTTNGGTQDSVRGKETALSNDADANGETRKRKHVTE